MCLWIWTVSLRWAMQPIGLLFYYCEIWNWISKTQMNWFWWKYRDSLFIRWGRWLLVTKSENDIMSTTKTLLYKKPTKEQSFTNNDECIAKWRNAKIKTTLICILQYLRWKSFWLGRCLEHLDWVFILLRELWTWFNV